MRIFLYGNKERAKWHLPVVEAKFRSFVMGCKARGLKQDRFTLRFEEDGTTVFGQYYYGSESIQIYSPGTTKVVKEKSKDDLSVEPTPKTFWVNTTKGYYWVEVRYTDGVPKVILTSFVAKKVSEDGLSDEFVYPGMGLTTPGMIAGCFEDNEEGRYTLSQNGGVMSGVGEEKGTIISTSITNGDSRISVVDNTSFSHQFVIMQNSAQTVEVRYLTIDWSQGVIGVERFYCSANMSFEGETIPTSNLLPNPCWVHRKCTGSYFSPNKTIGYHVDIGTDDGFWGNIFALGGGLQDKLDNTGGAGESLFNHTPDLYRIVQFMSMPVSVEEDKVVFIACCPTMIYYNNPEGDDRKCWGGYGLTQSWAGCVDYMGDFDVWMLAPRLVKCTWNMSSGVKEFQDFRTYSNIAKEEIAVESWDNSFSAKIIIDESYSCDTKFYEKMETEEVDYCTWDEEISGSCDIYGDPVGYSGTAAKRWAVLEHWSRYTRENIKNTRKIFFLFGDESAREYDPGSMHGFYFMFDGLWHLDIGVHWSTAKTTGNSCGLISSPLAGQNPGELVYFKLCGGVNEWVAENGHEYVEDLEVVAPLGYHIMPDSSSDGVGEYLGFIARVPESLDAPVPPRVLLGGVEYSAEGIEGEIVSCERKIMSRPCICTEVVWGPYATFGVSGVYHLYFTGGCPPFEWHISNGVLKDYYGNKLTKEQLEQARSVYAHTEDCYASVSMTDACMGNLKKTASSSVTGSISGPAEMEAGSQAWFYHNLGVDAVYSGSLTLVSQSGNAFLLKAPDGGRGVFDVSAYGSCGESVSTSVFVYGAHSLLCHIYYSAQSGGTYTCTSPYIGSGNYYIINSSWYSFWDSDSNPLCTPNCWFSDRNLEITVSGDTVSVHFSDNPYNDNRGYISVYIYRSS